MSVLGFQRHRISVVTIVLACFGIVASTSVVSAQELMGWWKLEENDVGMDVIDSSGNGWDGIFEGDVDPNVEGAPGWGSGAYFDGFTGQVLIGAGDETGLGDLTENFTVMAWIMPDQFDSKNRVFGSAPHGGAGWGWGTAGDSLQITTWGVKDYTQPVPLELDTWTHAAIVLDEDYLAHFYVNGEFIGTQTHSAPGLPTINDFYIGFACCDAEHFSGYIDEVAVFDSELTEEQIQNAMALGPDNINGDTSPTGDFDKDGSLGLGDLDLLLAEILAGTDDPAFDLTGDGAVNRADNDFFVTDPDLLGTWIGDSNLDGEFNSSDFVQVFTAGEYEDTTPLNSTWAEGDWTADGDFDSSDFVAAFTDGGFELGPKAAVSAVPEPTSWAMLIVGGLALANRRRRSKRS